MVDPLPTAPPPTPVVAPPAFDLKTILTAFVGVLTRPAAFYASVREQKGFGPPVIFAACMGVAAGIVVALYSILHLGAVAGAAGGARGMAAGLGAIIFMPIMAVLFGSFVGGALVHVIALIAGGKPTFEHSVRISSYACAVMPVGAVLGLVALLSSLANLYGLYVVAMGVVTLHLTDRKKTFIIAGVLAALGLVFAVTGYFAAKSVSPFVDEMQTKYGEGSEFQKNLAQSADQLKAMAEQMQKAAEAAQKEQGKGAEEAPAEQPNK